LYAGGNFTSIGGQARNYIAAVDAATSAATSFDPNANGSVNALVISSSTVYAGGGFSTVGGLPFRGFVAMPASGPILPVKLTSFNANKEGGNSVLRWQVAGEENIVGYNIERSTDGRNFTTVGRVASLGNTTIIRSYTFTDAAVLKGANYYRLQIVEKDGKVNYSAIRLLNFGSQFVVALYPNPAKDKATVTGVEAGMQIRLLDAVGKVLQVQTATGTTESLLLNRIAKGFYSVQVYGANGQLLLTKGLVKE
jgi:hypothetical protein